MSDYDYNALLTPGVWRGSCGQREVKERKDDVSKKCLELAKWISQAKHLVVFTGAGISTSAGIPDFRGPNGVWTLENKKNRSINPLPDAKPEKTVRFQDAMPTSTHMALVALEKASILKFIISQNVDGLHMASGIPRSKMAELHGNIFMYCCSECGEETLSEAPIPSVGFKELSKTCSKCGAKLHDCTLDWNNILPQEDMANAKKHLKKADLCLCLGSSLQVTPAADLPLKTKKKYEKPEPGRLVIINLQKTPRDFAADLLIRYYVDDIMSQVMELLNLSTITPIKYPLKQLQEEYCKIRPKNWLKTQLEPESGEDSESSEEEAEEISMDSNAPEEPADEWAPGNKTNKEIGSWFFFERTAPPRKRTKLKK